MKKSKDENMADEVGFDPNSYVFSVDLTIQSERAIHALSSIDSIPQLKDPEILAKSAYRYEKYWLPLAAEHSSEDLRPPVDVKWIWYCHMLSPRTYVSDCKAAVGKVIDHSLLTRDDTATAKSETVWNEMYRESLEPFNWNFEYNETQMKEFSEFQSKLSYDLVAAALRQKDFYYQVSLPHYRNAKFIKEAVLRYKKFLYLQKRFPKNFSVPFYDIDLIWHTHQLNPTAYQKDTEKYLGCLLDHDDAVTDRSEGSKLHKAELATRKLWWECFHETLATHGTMYRGKPHKHELSYVKTEDIEKIKSTKIANIVLQEIALYSLGRRKLGKLELHIRMYSKVNKYQCPLVFKRSTAKKEYQGLVWDRNELEKRGPLTFDTTKYDSLHVALIAVPGGCSCLGMGYSSRSTISQEYHNFVAVIEDAVWKSDSKSQFKIEIRLSGDFKLTISGVLTEPQLKSVFFNLGQRSVKYVSTPIGAESLWGPFSVEQLTPGKSISSDVISHRYVVVLFVNEFVIFFYRTCE